MKSQIAEMKEVQKHPIKAALQNTIKSLELKVAGLRGRLSQIKNSIIKGCKSAIAAAKENGAAALNNLASFFQIKSELQSWKKDIDQVIIADNKAVAEIEAFTREYHSAGRAIKNMVRLAVGKSPIDAKKEAGKLSKALAAPYKAQANALTGLKKGIDKVIEKLDQLDASTTARQAERMAAVAAKKPSLLNRLKESLALVEEMKREAPVQERVQAKGAEI